MKGKKHQDYFLGGLHLYFQIFLTELRESATIYFIDLAHEKGSADRLLQIMQVPKAILGVIVSTFYRVGFDEYYW